LLWVGSALILNDWIRQRRRSTLADRLLPFQTTIADEPEPWLKWQR
jgi:hypothetical protein